MKRLNGILFHIPANKHHTYKNIEYPQYHAV